MKLTSVASGVFNASALESTALWAPADEPTGAEVEASAWNLAPAAGLFNEHAYGFQNIDSTFMPIENPAHHFAMPYLAEELSASHFEMPVSTVAGTPLEFARPPYHELQSEKGVSKLSEFIAPIIPQIEKAKKGATCVECSVYHKTARPH